MQHEHVISSRNTDTNNDLYRLQQSVKRPKYSVYIDQMIVHAIGAVCVCVCVFNKFAM